MAKLSNREFSLIFDTAASGYDASTNPYTLSRRIAFVAERARGACLEVGAGTAEMSRALLKDHVVTATDISPKMVEQIQKKLSIPTAVCDAQELPFPDASFDTVVAGEMIYYLDAPERFIAEAHRVLRPQGRLLVTSATSVARMYDRVRTILRKLGFGSMYFEDNMHDFPRVAELLRTIGNGGFAVEEEQRFIILPIRALDFLNRVLEKTPLKYGAIFTGICAKKI